MLKNQVMICGDYQIELLIPFLIMRAVVVGEVIGNIKLKFQEGNCFGPKEYNKVVVC